MQFETFRGRNVEEALAAVKAALGADALIESTRHVSNGGHGYLGKSFVEVTAAPGAGTGRTNPFSRNVPSQRAPEPIPAAPRALRELSAMTEAFASEAVRGARHEGGINRELRAIRSLLEEMSHGRRPKDRAMSLLQAAGIEGSLATDVANGAARVTRADPLALQRFLRRRLEERLEVMQSPLELPGPRVIACIGPTGVGKTTTLAKLAARAHLELGRSTSVVTLDTFRVGAVEQMRRFVELIGVPLDVARDRSSFNQAMAQRRADITLVDTAGVCTADNAGMQRLAACIEAVTDRPVDILLVVQASVRPRDVDRLRAVYKNPQPKGLVVTKLDETDQAGGALHAALDTRTLPIAYLCDGPRVPEDVHDATVEMLLDAVLPLST
ncbi:MAG TPA: flagellar biosynthesis protein FlhF [Polyangiaceae bacterium]|nr:flagellar biosynthesis protein FlhF [Polyangiaceae bacterium]